MSQYTEHYNLIKPSGPENALISQINANMDILDAAIYDASQHGFIPADIINLIYPIGSIIILANNTDPNNIYQGTTWEKIEGKFLLGSSSDYALGSTGGEATHTLTEQEMPTHYHESMRWNGPNGSPLSDPNSSGVTGYAGNFGGLSKIVASGRWYTSNAGDGQAHNNMPPYEVVNYWKRTA